MPVVTCTTALLCIAYSLIAQALWRRRVYRAVSRRVSIWNDGLVLCCMVFVIFCLCFWYVLGSRENMKVVHFQFLPGGIRPPATLRLLSGDCWGFTLHRGNSATWVWRWYFGEMCCLSLLASLGLGRVFDCRINFSGTYEQIVLLLYMYLGLGRALIAG